MAVKIGALVLFAVAVISEASLFHQHHKHPIFGQIPLPQQLFNQFEYIKCDLGKMIKCGQAFTKELGYKGDPKDAQAFFAFLGMKYQGKTGFDSICDSITHLENCYGTGLGQCATLENLEKMGLTKPNALAYQAFYHLAAYECGPGREVIDKNWECIESAQKAGEAQFRQCLTKFQTQIREHPEKTCQYAQEYDICVAQLFVKCGKAVENVLCNVVAKTMEMALPKCKFQCHLLLENMPTDESYQDFSDENDINVP